MKFAPKSREGTTVTRYFNTAGPINPREHYCLPLIERFDLEEVLLLMEQKKYFALHAPRQTGKTSSLLALMKYLHTSGKYHCLDMNVEAAQGAREDVKRGMRSILNEMALRARVHLNDPFLTDIWPGLFEISGEDNALSEILTRWAIQNPKPLVLLMDEIDALVGDTLISVLRQIRSGYDRRPSDFPQSIILCGVRDVRDYRIRSDREKSVVTGGSAFNIKAESLRMGNFTEAEVHRLIREHIDETGQNFEPEALSLIWAYSKGQPWLVNALAYETCFKMESGRDRTKPITGDMVVQAKENLILRRETHLDQLADKLGEDRVKRVILPLLTGEDYPTDIPTDDVQYARDLGLISVEGQIEIANDLYREVIPRELTYSTQVTISHQPSWYIDENGFLNMEKLLTAFQEFFREHSEHWVERFSYKEAGPQLLLQAFLQRIINSGGRIDREYGLGRKRADLLIHRKHDRGIQKAVIEMKILHKSLEKTIAEGLRQTSEYMDKCGTEDGHLIIFDRRPEEKWSEKIFRRDHQYEGKTIRVWGM